MPSNTRIAPRRALVDLSFPGHRPGIPRRALKHVFEDFYRVDDEMVRNAGGTGIGLALVRKFALAMGGSGRKTTTARAVASVSACR
jgi:signal transduction histidine kinase